MTGDVAVQAPVLTGIIQADADLGVEQAHELQDRFRKWATNPSTPLILGKGVRFRQMRPDGTLEPDPRYDVDETVELVSTRDWAPYIVAVGGWVAALVAIIVR